MDSVKKKVKRIWLLAREKADNFWDGVRARLRQHAFLKFFVFCFVLSMCWRTYKLGLGTAFYFEHLLLFFAAVFPFELSFLFEFLFPFNLVYFVFLYLRNWFYSYKVVQSNGFEADCDVFPPSNLNFRITSANRLWGTRKGKNKGKRTVKSSRIPFFSKRKKANNDKSIFSWFAD